MTPFQGVVIGSMISSHIGNSFSSSFFFEKTKQPKVTRADVERISRVNGWFDFILFQFQTDFLSIMAHRVVCMDNKIKLKFLSAVRPYYREIDGGISLRK
jgi:hypothetical protein